MSAPVAVVIPAHNEAAVLGRLLRALATGCDPARDLDVLVVTNGCTDATTAVAASFAFVRVVDLDVASKAAALQGGDEHATAFPRCYVDADVEVTGRAVLDVVAAMRERGALAGAPRLRLDLSHSSWLVRRYYQAWTRTPWATTSLLGSGFYCLSEAGRARFDRWPERVADDLFISRLFATGERAVAQDHEFVVRPPRQLRNLVGVRARVLAGNSELGDLGGVGAGGSAVPVLVRATVRDPRLLPALVVYVAVQLVARRRADRFVREREIPWSRDDSARQSG